MVRLRCITLPDEGTGEQVLTCSGAYERSGPGAQASGPRAAHPVCRRVPDMAAQSVGRLKTPVPSCDSLAAPVVTSLAEAARGRPAEPKSSPGMPVARKMAQDPAPAAPHTPRHGAGESDADAGCAFGPRSCHRPRLRVPHVSAGERQRLHVVESALGRTAITSSRSFPATPTGRSRTTPGEIIAGGGSRQRH